MSELCIHIHRPNCLCTFVSTNGFLFKYLANSGILGNTCSNCFGVLGVNRIVCECMCARYYYYEFDLNAWGHSRIIWYTVYTYLPMFSSIINHFWNASIRAYNNSTCACVCVFVCRWLYEMISSTYHFRFVFFYFYLNGIQLKMESKSLISILSICKSIFANFFFSLRQG